MNFESAPINSSEKEGSEQEKKPLSGAAQAFIDRTLEGKYSGFDNVPEIVGKTMREKVDFLIENGIDPLRVAIRHASKYTEEPLSETRTVAAMAQKPEMASALFNHLYDRDVEFSREQIAIAILGVARHGDQVTVESDEFFRILTSSSLDEEKRSEIASILHERGFEGVAEKFEGYYAA